MDNIQARSLNALAKSLLESRLPYEIFIEGTYSVQLVDTEKYLTQKNKNSNGTNYYAAFADIAAVQADATKNGVELSDYNWTFNFKKITKKVPTGEYDEATGDDITVDVEQTSIYNANGYVSELGYVIESTDETQAPAFRFFKQNQEDETFAIMNQSGAYWNGSFAWKSPYDQVNTTATRNYQCRGQRSGRHSVLLSLWHVAQCTSEGYRAESTEHGRRNQEDHQGSREMMN